MAGYVASIPLEPYHPSDGTPPEQGIAAFARALERVDLAWALVGALICLPVLRSVLQLFADASGFGPRVVRRRGVCEVASAD